VECWRYNIDVPKNVALNIFLYVVSSGLMTALQDLIRDVISIQKYHTNIGPILNGYGATDI
jgi:hypothetical protein